MSKQEKTLDKLLSQIDKRNKLIADKQHKLTTNLKEPHYGGRFELQAKHSQEIEELTDEQSKDIDSAIEIHGNGTGRE